MTAAAPTFRCVLVAVDLEHADTQGHVLAEAARLAALDGAALTVVTVVPPLGGPLVASYFKDGTEQAMLADAAERLHAFVRDALGADAGVQHVVAHGAAYEQILATAAELSADLIVMGAHRPGLRDWLLGANAARVARHAECSVHIVRDPD